MKRKGLLILLLSLLLASSAFSKEYTWGADWKRYGVYESEAAGLYEVYFDQNATEPFDLEKENIKYFLYLQKNYKNVEVHLYNMESSWWCAKGVELECYATREVHRKCTYEWHVNNDGTVIEYLYWD